MMKWKAAAAAAFVVQAWCGSAWANPFAYRWQELAPGVWGGIRQDPFELPQEGNSVFVVTGDGVVVFDAGGSPAMGESIVAKVGSVTDKPITQVILSHWHGDHMRGLQAIQSAFPAAQVIAHPHTREFIMNGADKWLQRRVSMVPNIRKALNDAFSSQQDLQGRPLIDQERVWLEQGLASADELDRENRRTTFVVPNAVFTDQLTFYSGDREIQVIHPGNAHTAGDLILWLPRERIVATGDIVTAPVPLMPSAYVRDYPAVLAQIKALGFTALVPGHGPVQHDSGYLDLLSETVRTVSAQMHVLVQQGLTQEDAVARIDFSRVEPRFTRGDAFLEHRFSDYVATALPQAAYAVERGGAPGEKF